MSNPKFQTPEPRLNFNEMNERIIKFWKDNQIFEKSISQRDKNNRYVFYDGPPFVTGLPHYGSLLPSIAKDLIPRYQTMKGKRVRRVWGWDCHGLPIENKVEEKLGLKNRKDIEKIGLKTFIEGCRYYVSQTSSEWNWYIDHIGRWVDIDNAYRTMDMDFMESTMWVFKQIYDKGLIYKGKRISLFCPRCGTPVSNFEIAMDNSYKDVTEESSTYKFKLTLSSINKIRSVILDSNKIRDRESISIKQFNNVFFLAWSTTPWNKIVTTALAVNPKFTYLLVKQENEYFILAESRQEILTGDYTIISKFKGTDLLNLTYEPLYEIDKAPEDKKAWVVIGGDFVTHEEGSGIVTMAVYGEDDFKAMKENNVWLWEHVNEEGMINLNHPLFQNIYYLKANKIVDDDLQKRGLIYRHDNLTHSIPLCWRCSTRLMYKPQSAWFLRVSQIRQKLIDSNENIYWFPEHIKKGRFYKGIEQAPDWCVSRSRYWATPMPIWQCQKCKERKVIGSIKELEDLTGKKVTDLHRPYIDEFTFPCEKCGGEMKRVEDVLDSWMESGSMPYGERHYPFENKQELEENFPADFIVEYIAQTRAWFYVMHVVSNSLFDKNAFKNVICTGVIKGTDGRKMSKSYGNYPDPKKTIETYGGDALRLYLMSSPVMSGETLNISEEEIKEQNQRVLSILWNSYVYFVTYANLHNFTPNEKSVILDPNEIQDRESIHSDNNETVKQCNSKNILDQWILIKVQELINLTTQYLDEYNIPKATRLIRDFINDLSTWYIRESRDRFSIGDLNALQTLYEALQKFCLVAAPTIPFITEEIWQNLNSTLLIKREAMSTDMAGRFKDSKNTPSQNNSETVKPCNNETISLHLQSWPKVKPINQEQKLILQQMELVKIIAQEGNALRKIKQIPVRQPLSSLSISSPNEKLTDEYFEILKTELNVKKIFWQKADNLSISYDFNLTADLIDEGEARQIIRKIQELRKKTNTQRDAFITVSLSSWPKNFEEEIKKKALVKEIKKGDKIEII